MHCGRTAFFHLASYSNTPDVRKSRRFFRVSFGYVLLTGNYDETLGRPGIKPRVGPAAFTVDIVTTV